MKAEYDFSNAKRGTIAKQTKGKARITIRIDEEILEWFRARVHADGGGNYQTLINRALRDHITQQDDVLADTLRRVLREEMADYSARPARRTAKKRAIPSR